METVDATFVVQCACDACDAFVEPANVLCPQCWAACVHAHGDGFVDLHEHAMRASIHTAVTAAPWLGAVIAPDPPPPIDAARAVAESVVDVHTAAVDHFGMLKTVGTEIAIAAAVAIGPELKRIARQSLRSLVKRRRKRSRVP